MEQTAPTAAFVGGPEEPPADDDEEFDPFAFFGKDFRFAFD
jgi:hypothetical protein